MDEDKQNQPVTPAENNGGTSQGDQAPAPQSNNSEHARNQEVVVNGEPSPAGNGQHDDNAENLDRLKSKVSKLESELSKTKNKPKKRVHEVMDQATISRLDNQFANDPARYEAWRADIVDKGFEDPGSWSQLYSPQPAQQQNSQNQANTMPQGEDLYQAIDRVHELKSFINAHPEFDPNGATDEDEAVLRRENVDFVMKTATARQALAKRQGRNISRTEAINQGLIALDPEKYIKRAEENARLAGRQDAYVGGNGTSGISGGSSTRNNDEVVLNDTDREVARMLKLTDEQMLAQKKASAVMPRYS